MPSFGPAPSLDDLAALAEAAFAALQSTLKRTRELLADGRL